MRCRVRPGFDPTNVGTYLPMSSPYIVGSTLKVILHHACPITSRMPLAVEVDFVEALVWMDREEERVVMGGAWGVAWG